MAVGDKYWLGNAAAVAQVTTVTVGGTLSGETFTISVGGEAIASHTDADTVIATTVADLVSDWNSSTNAWATGITAADASPDITLTADTAGVPFIVTLNTPGGSATFSQAATTANAGPNDWDTPANWSGAAKPTGGANVVFADSAVNVAWGLDQSGITVASLKIQKSYTGKIGLDRTTFATAVDGTSPVVKSEYRDTYLQIGATIVEVGENVGPGTPNGSGRILLDLAAVASTITVFSTGTASETAKESFRFIASTASTDLIVREAKGGVGIAVDFPNETSTVGDVLITAPTLDSRVSCSAGTTLTNWRQSGGKNMINAAATITAVEVDGGTLTLEGNYTVTTLDLHAGTVTDNHIKTAAAAITTCNLNGGILDLLKNKQARTITTMNLTAGQLKADGGVITITTLNDPAGEYSIVAS